MSQKATFHTLVIFLSLQLLPLHAKAYTFIDQDIINLLNDIEKTPLNNSTTRNTKLRLLKSLVDYRVQLPANNQTTTTENLTPSLWHGMVETLTTDYINSDSGQIFETKNYLLHSNNTIYSLMLFNPSHDIDLNKSIEIQGIQYKKTILVTAIQTNENAESQPSTPDDTENTHTPLLAQSEHIHTIQQSSSAEACTSTGNQHALVVAVNYQDNPSTSPSINTINERHFGQSDSLAAYWDETSYGKTQLTGDTLGWHTLNSNITSANACIMQSDIRQQVLDYAANNVDLNNYNRLIIVMKNPIPACNWAGRSTNTCVNHTLSDGTQTAKMSTYWTLSSYQNSIADAVHLAAHEAGHTLDLDHANVRDWGNQVIGPIYDDNGSNFVEYGDRYDPMGTSWVPTHYNAQHKFRLNWLESTDVDEINGNATLSLEPLAIQPPFQAPKAIKLYRGSSANGLKEYLWLETRDATGFDAYTDHDGRYTIHVHQERNGANRTTTMLDTNPNTSSGTADYFDAPIKIGESFTDPYSNITISNLGVDSNNHVMVQITTPADFLDSDEDGLTAALEAIAGSNPNEIDSDNDNMSDLAEVCHDGDCSSYSPYPAGGDTNPNLIDTDGDSMDDHWEWQNGLDPVDPTDKFLDPDNDGSSNYDEYLAETSPQGADADGDGLLDGEESLYGTDPNNSDSDFDNQSDGWEVANNLNPLDAADATLDPDFDTLSNAQEFALGTNIYASDSDGDTLSDADEVNLFNTNPASNDTDNDRLYDNEELDNNTDPLTISNDTDGDGMHDDWEVIRGTDSTINDAAMNPDRDNSNNIVEYLRATLPQDAESFPDLQTITIDLNDLYPGEDGTAANPYIDRLNPIVSAAEPGDTVILPTGYFFEHASFSLSNHITLQGQDDKSTVIQAPIVGTSLNTWCELKNITIEATVTTALISSNANFIGNIVHIQGNGMTLQAAHNATIKNNIFSTPANGNGINILNSNHVEIINNTLHNFTNGVINTSGTDIYLSNNILTNSTDIVGNNFSTISFNIISDGQFSGIAGNMQFWPDYIDAANLNFHIGTSSPAIATGDPQSDYAMEPQPNGNRINRGAYGGTSQAATVVDIDNDGLPDGWESAHNLNLSENDNLLDNDSDGIYNYHEFWTGTDPNNQQSSPSLDNNDRDNDGVDDAIDNCPFSANPNQEDSDFNFVGDACAEDYKVPSLPIALYPLLALLLALAALKKKRFM